MIVFADSVLRNLNLCNKYLYSYTLYITVKKMETSDSSNQRFGVLSSKVSVIRTVWIKLSGPLLH